MSDFVPVEDETSPSGASDHFQAIVREGCSRQQTADEETESAESDLFSLLDYAEVPAVLSRARPMQSTYTLASKHYALLTKRLGSGKSLYDTTCIAKEAKAPAHHRADPLSRSANGHARAGRTVARKCGRCEWQLCFSSMRSMRGKKARQNEWKVRSEIWPASFRGRSGAGATSQT
ncbi:uncharacterized protein SPSK_05587 [Sporothrix schenckii 1099-18]|uniref:Uncharacterized protein n=1 Tax=Sporothrix schenckii 1099-18 TaxID=1397361 RepID=A0A0F2LYI8_SPOSC|nr:uncharacterized protein SPSK_05587 [Sporothrix schenckii 1099-18]KJR80946.1 hypothetical protein SPSK_05587 [Sporothrix schenckii 1099-18]